MLNSRLSKRENAWLRAEEESIVISKAKPTRGCKCEARTTGDREHLEAWKQHEKDIKTGGERKNEHLITERNDLKIKKGAGENDRERYQGKKCIQKRIHEKMERKEQGQAERIPRKILGKKGA